MRLVFVDEAGTSAHEPITIVVGLIAHADEHVMSGEALVHETLGAVPKQFADSFVFHSTDVFQNPKYQEAWGLTDRLNLLQGMMRIPHRLGMGVCVAAMWRGAVDFKGHGVGLSVAQSDHLHTFALCLGHADNEIRNNASPSEVAMVVAEDVPEMRRFLRIVPRVYRNNPIMISQAHMRKTVSDEEAGYIRQSGDFRITRIRNSVHFVEKADDPLVQVADACAYGLRRYFAEEKFGVEFARATVGSEHRLRNFARPGGAECYWP